MRKVSSVYVAASSNELERAEKWISLLRAAGIVVTSGWVENIREKGISNPREGATVDADRSTSAVVNRDNVERADLLWFLVPAPEAEIRDNHGRGGYYEAGLADAWGKVLVFSGDTRQSVFCTRGVEFKEDLAAFAYICKVARDGAP